MEYTFEKQRFSSLQLCRGVSALCICFYHINYLYNTGVCFGAVINIFFCISGFVMMYTTQNNVNHYFSKRIIRIIPLYWLLTIGTFFLIKIVPSLFPNNPTIIELFKSMFFIPYSRAGLRASDALRPIVGPGWTLNYEVLFYVVFGISLLFSKKYRGIICSILILVFYTLGRVFDFSNSDILYFWTNYYMLYFVAGILMFYVMKNIYKYKFNFVINLFTGLIALFSFVFILSGYNIPNLYHLDSVIVSLIFVISFMLLLRGVNIPNPLVKFGDISFSFYLIHYYVILLVGKFLNLNIFSFKSVFGTVTLLIITTVAAYLSYELIEVKLTKCLRKKLKI